MRKLLSEKSQQPPLSHNLNVTKAANTETLTNLKYWIHLILILESRMFHEKYYVSLFIFLAWKFGLRDSSPGLNRQSFFQF